MHSLTPSLIQNIFQHLRRLGRSGVRAVSMAGPFSSLVSFELKASCIHNNKLSLLWLLLPSALNLHYLYVALFSPLDSNPLK